MTMSEQHQSFLPRVGSADLESNVFSDGAESPTERWNKIAKLNPLFAREQMLRAYKSTYLLDPSLASIEQARQLINFGIYTATVLDVAAEREQGNARTAANDVAVEVQLLSDELGDDPPSASLAPTQLDS